MARATTRFGGASKEDRDASQSDDAAEDPPDRSGGTTTQARTGTIAALSTPGAGSTQLANDDVATVGSSVDAAVDPQTGDKVVASDSQSTGQSGSGQSEVNVATPDGGVDVSVGEDGELDPGRPGGSSRITEVVRNYREAGQSPTQEPSGDTSTTSSTDSTGGTSPGDVVDSTSRRAQQAFGSSGMGFGGSGIGFPGDKSDGGILDTLTSPVGLVLAVVTVAALVFGGSQAVDDGGDSGGA